MVKPRTWPLPVVLRVVDPLARHLVGRRRIEVGRQSPPGVVPNGVRRDGPHFIAARVDGDEAQPGLLEQTHHEPHRNVTAACLDVGNARLGEPDTRGEVALAQVAEPAHPQHETGNVHGLTLTPGTDTAPPAPLRH
jgi:hypothetical protein